ncbi:hypothetical protein [Sorangium sp. So ce385]|uniref:hypothetical protein n=1 Tax=Sorangium sp. So ce385 TaxID=3133308 RepID=UPI003F5AF162
MIRRWAAALLAGACAGCHGSGPLLHPAHVLLPGKVSVGAGVSGDMVVAGATAAPPAAGDAAATEGAARRRLSEIAVSPGVAPWASARVGIEGGNEAGLTYSGRALRLDGRHAFPLGDAALSVGLGASALFAGAPGPSAGPSAEGGDAVDVYGAGVDVPILLGFRSDADLYALWFGPRLGLELLGGEVRLPPAGSASRGPLVDASGQHLRLGFVLGVRAGFRHVHVALEATATYHHATGEIGGAPAVIDQGTIAPGGGLTVTF